MLHSVTVQKIIAREVSTVKTYNLGQDVEVSDLLYTLCILFRHVPISLLLRPISHLSVNESLNVGVKVRR